MQETYKHAEDLKSRFGNPMQLTHDQTDAIAKLAQGALEPENVVFGAYKKGNTIGIHFPNAHTTTSAEGLANIFGKNVSMDIRVDIVGDESVVRVPKKAFEKTFH